MDMTLPPKVTDRAFARLAEIAEAEGRPVMLRVAVEGGGCSGFQYEIDLAETASDEDLKLEKDGQTVLVDPVSLPFLSGATIDFTEELIRRPLRHRQPQRDVELRLRDQLLDLI